MSSEFVNAGEMLQKNEKLGHLRLLLHLNDHCDIEKKKRGKGKKGLLLSFIWRIKILPHWYFNCNSWGLFVFQTARPHKPSSCTTGIQTPRSCRIRLKEFDSIYTQSPSDPWIYNTGLTSWFIIYLPKQNWMAERRNFITFYWYSPDCIYTF